MSSAKKVDECPGNSHTFWVCSPSRKAIESSVKFIFIGRGLPTDYIQAKFTAVSRCCKEQIIHKLTRRVCRPDNESGIVIESVEAPTSEHNAIDIPICRWHSRSKSDNPTNHEVILVAARTRSLNPHPNIIDLVHRTISPDVAWSEDTYFTIERDDLLHDQ